MDRQERSIDVTVSRVGCSHCLQGRALREKGDPMDEILNIYERLDGRTTLDDFKAKIDEKVATMGGLCDEHRSRG
jgi:hypothetical protein